jgi:porin
MATFDPLNRLRFAALLFLPVGLALADPPTAPPSNALETAAASIENEFQNSAQKGVLLKLGYTGEVFGNFSGDRQGAEYEGLLKLEARCNLETLLHLPRTVFYASVLDTHGKGLTDQYVHDLNVLSNIDAYDTFRLYELWLQYGGPLDRFSIRVGQLASDAKFFGTDSSQLFINNSFGVFGTINNDITAPDYPTAAPGLRLRYKPEPHLYLQLAAFDGNPGHQNLNDKYGTHFGLNRGDGAFLVAEAKYRWHQKENDQAGWDPTGELPGTYTAGFFWATRTFADETGAASHRGDYGGYVAVDQQVYGPKDGPGRLSLFARFSATPADRNFVSWYADGGFNLVGPFPGGEADVFGMALAYTRISDDFSDGLPIEAHHETVLEATYLRKIDDYLSVQPDLQFVFDPGGLGRSKDAIVAGLRFILTF